MPTGHPGTRLPDGTQHPGTRLLTVEHMPVEIITALDTIAAERKVSRSAYIRTVLGADVELWRAQAALKVSE